VKPQICASIAAENISEALRLIKEAEARGADLLELRLDYLNDLGEISRIVKSTSLPIVATNRQFEQGGHRQQKEDERVKALLEAADQGFQYVDMELTTADRSSLIHELKKAGVKIIVSFHDFKRTPSVAEMEKIVESQTEAGADICKLVTTANSMDDNLSCLLLTSKMSRKIKIVCFAMGKMGMVSRVLCPLFGAQFTYASVESGRETASGQLSISDLKNLYSKLGVEN
jgi:3-dehydroquinate dehydratase type I